MTKQVSLLPWQGRFSDMPGAIDAAQIVQFRHQRGLAPWLQSGGPDPPPRVTIRWLECAWFNEIAMFSQREQTSFFYVVDKMGARGLIHMVRRNVLQRGPIRNLHAVPHRMGRRARQQQSVG